MSNSNNLYSKVKESAIHGLVYGLGSSLQQLVSVILLPLYTSVLSTSEYGELGLLRITGMLASNILWLGITSALFRSYFDYSGKEGKAKVVSTSLVLLLMSLAFGTVLAFIFRSSLSYFLFSSPRNSELLFFAIITAFLNSIAGIPLAVFRANKKSVRYTVSQLGSVSAGILITYVLIKYFNMAIAGAIYGTLCMNLILNLILFISIRKEIKFVFSVSEAKKLLKFGIPLIPTGLALYFFTSADRYILEHYKGLSDLGIYNLAYQFGIIAMVLFVQPVKLVWPPMFYSQGSNSSRDIFHGRALTFLMLYGALLFLGVSLLSKYIIYKMAHEDYWAVVPIIPIVALANILLGIESLVSIGIALKRKTKIYAYYFAFASVLSIVLNILLVPSLGIMGTAISKLLTFIILLVFGFYFGMKFSPFCIEYLRLLKIVITTATTYLILSHLELNSWVLSFIAKMFIILTIPLLLYFIGFYTRSEIDRFLDLKMKFLRRLRK